MIGARVTKKKECLTLFKNTFRTFDATLVYICSPGSVDMLKTINAHSHTSVYCNTLGIYVASAVIAANATMMTSDIRNASLDIVTFTTELNTFPSYLLL